MIKWSVSIDFTYCSEETFALKDAGLPKLMVSLGGC